MLQLASGPGMVHRATRSYSLSVAHEWPPSAPLRVVVFQPETSESPREAERHL